MTTAPEIHPEIALRLALAHEQGGIISGTIVEGTQVGIAEDIDVMHEHRTVGIEEGCRLAQSASRLEQHVALVRHQELHSLYGLGVQVVDDLVGEVVHVDHSPTETGIVEPPRHMTQERLIAHGHQCLGHGVGERPQAGTESGGENHGLSHHCCFVLSLPMAGSMLWISRSRWQMRTSTPNFAWICSARCCAE